MDKMVGKLDEGRRGEESGSGGVIKGESRPYQICSRCVMDTSDPQIVFDENGVCDFCRGFDDSIAPNWHTDERGMRELRDIAAKIKASARGDYDCLLGFSGGADSSYVAYIAKEILGLNPLLVEVDTGWNLSVADENSRAVKESLGLDSVRLGIDWDEMRRLQIAFFKAGVPYQDLPQDQAIFAALYNYAAREGYAYILTGANFATECVKPPEEWTYYADVVFMKDVFARFGEGSLKKYPFLDMFKKRVVYGYLKGIKRVAPLNYLPYDKEKVEQLLADKCGWKCYEQKHYENRFTRFYEGWYLPQRFGYDKRHCYESSLILAGQRSRQEALERIAQAPYDAALMIEDKRYICKKLEVSEEEFDSWMNGEKRTWRDFNNSHSAISLFVKIAVMLGVEKRKLR